MGFQNLSLRNKIVWPTLIIVFIVLAISIWVMTDRTQEIAIEQAIEIADGQAMSYSQNIRASLDAAMAVTRTLQSVFNEALRGDPIPKREFFSGMLKNVLENHPELSGSWIACLPGTFDDREEEYKKVWKGTMRVYHYRDGNTIKTSHAGVDKLSGDWFDIPMAGRGETISKPYPWEVDGKTNWLDSTGLPVQKKGKNIGVVGVDFFLADLQKMVKKINPYGVGYGFLLGNDGAVIAHPDDSFLGKALGELVDAKYLQAFQHAVKNGKPFSFTADLRNSGQLDYVTAVPIVIGNTPTPWSLSVIIPLSAVKQKARTVAQTGILVGLAAIIALLVTLLFLSRVIATPVRKIAGYANAVANGDLDAPLDIDQTDETGRMADSLRIMVSKLKENMQAERKARKMEEESSRAAQAGIKAESARKEALLDKNKGLTQAAERVADVLERVVAASTQMLRQSDALLASTEEQSDRIASTATAMEEMNSTVVDIARNAGNASSAGMETQNTAEEGASVLDQSKKAMNTTMTEVEKLNDNMRRLDKQAQGIGAIIGVINDIADQTNLLALNAAIEAARAGEAGRGFAVVADEVRKLAEKTMDATKEVSTSISEIQVVADANKGAVETVVSHIGKAGDLSEQSEEMLRNILSSAEHSASQIAGIATAAEEQSAASDKINSAIEHISMITDKTADSAREFTSALHTLEEQISALNTIVEELRMQSNV